MISFFSRWAQGIIVAVILATIIEMILPKGTCQKYIKVVIGMFVLFTIISPVIQAISNGEDFAEIFNLSDYEKIIEQSEDEISDKIKENNQRSIKDLYVSKLKENIKSGLQNKGYDVNSCVVQVKDDENYTIEKIKLTIQKSENKRQDEIVINKVEINLSNEENTYELPDENEKDIREYLSSTYGVEEDIIEIN